MSVHRIGSITLYIRSDTCVDKINNILSSYGPSIVGRLGIPNVNCRPINVICLIIDSPESELSSLAGKLGRINGVQAKATISREIYPPL